MLLFFPNKIPQSFVKLFRDCDTVFIQAIRRVLKAGMGENNFMTDVTKSNRGNTGLWVVDDVCCNT